MKTIFLAAGKSSRVNPIDDKNFLEFYGKPLIAHLLENAKSGGLENFIFVCNKENKNKIANALQKQNIKYSLVIQPESKDGMAGGVLAGLSLVDDSEDVFVLGGNDFVNPSIYKKIIKKSQEFSGGILAKKVDSYFPGGYINANSENIIHSIVEKPEEGKEPSNLVNIVCHYFKNSADLKKALKNTHPSTENKYEKSLQLLFSTEKFVAVEYFDYWQSIKYPWHILDMQAQVLAIKNPGIFVANSAKISKKSTFIGDGIYIDENAKIMNNSTISGPCYIGKNTIIGQNCLIRESNIGKGCTIGFNSEISRSFLAKNVSTHSSYIGDSIIDEGVNFGAFSVTTNLRFDSKDISMKIKEKLIDSKRKKLGCVIGKNSQIGSGTKIFPGRKLSPKTHTIPNSIFS